MSETPTLPPEVISLVLDFLPYKERLAVATVCKQWYDLVFRTRFCCERLVLHVKPDMILAELQNSLLLQRCPRMNVQLNGIDEEGTVWLKSLLANVADGLLQLKVVGSYQELKSILEDTVPNLRQLIELEIVLKSKQNYESATYNNLEELVLYESDCSGRAFIETMTLANSYLRHLILKDINNELPYINGNFPALTRISMHNSALSSDSDDILFNVEMLSLSDIDMPEDPNDPDCTELPFLKKLCIANTSFDSRTLGAVLALSELRLVKTKIAFSSLRDSIFAMKQLLKLELVDVMFQDDTLSSTCLVSDSITEFKLYSSEDSNFLVDLPNLESLSFISTKEAAPQIFEQTWINHQKLRRWSFGVCEGQIGTFLTESSIAHINKLPSLQTLEFVRLSLENVDWSQCHRNQIKKIRLLHCPIDGREAQKLAATFPGLSELFLDFCYLRQPAEVFEVAENFSEREDLRRRLPRCRVSYHDCKVEDSRVSFQRE